MILVRWGWESLYIELQHAFPVLKVYYFMVISVILFSFNELDFVGCFVCLFVLRVYVVLAVLNSLCSSG